MTQLGEGTAETKRRVALDELMPADGDVNAVKRLVRRLSDERLLTTSTEKDSTETNVEIAHEALIRGWSKLQTWIEENREGLRFRQRLSDAAREWQENDREDSYLLHGQRLERAEEWFREHRSSVNPLEHDFLIISKAADLVAALAAAETPQLGKILKELEPLGAVATGCLEKMWEQADEGSRARRHAGLGLVQIGAGNLSFLRHSEKPDERTDMIHVLGRSGVSADALLRQLQHANDVSVRRALILSLGELDEAQWQSAGKQHIADSLLELYCHDPDAGVHAAAEWVLRKMAYTAKLTTIDGQLATGKVEDDRGWYLCREGHTMALIADTVASGKTNGKETQLLPPRPFAIATKPVTVEQFLRFRPDHEYDKGVSRVPACPVNRVNWYAAAAYCNWLSQREGVSHDQWCYVPNEKGDFAAGMVVPSDCLQRTGYRLATKAEWEYACRAGATTEYCFGDVEEMLVKYACYNENSDGKMFPVGTLKPNDFGLFDVHGNVWEWCQSRYDAAPETESPSGSDERIQDEHGRVLRGGSFSNNRSSVRSAARYGSNPGSTWDNDGFRVARTYD